VDGVDDALSARSASATIRSWSNASGGNWSSGHQRAFAASLPERGAVAEPAARYATVAVGPRGSLPGSE
jgi:hypothetical protein